MAILGIALIVGGLALVCGSVIFRLFARREPSSSQEESFEEGLFRISDEMRRAQGADRSGPAEHVPDDPNHRDR
jgi:hypothetical protein